MVLLVWLSVDQFQFHHCRFPYLITLPEDISFHTSHSEAILVRPTEQYTVFFIRLNRLMMPPKPTFLRLFSISQPMWIPLIGRFFLIQAIRFLATDGPKLVLDPAYLFIVPFGNEIYYPVGLTKTTKNKYLIQK